MEIFPEFSNTFNFAVILRLVVAAILGGIIGFERSGNRHEAGLRTHIIVCLGAAAVMIIGEQMSIRYFGDPARLSAQVISGIGFLGAGSIILDGSRIRGITTAAGIWTTACVGIVVGAGYYITAISVVALMMIAMLGLRSFGQKLQNRSSRHVIEIDCKTRDGVRDILAILSDNMAKIKSVKFGKTDGETQKVTIDFSVAQDVDFDQLVAEIVSKETVLSAIPHAAN